MRIYNTLTRQKQELVPLEPGKIRLYVCGPTVYNYFHIGNARCFVVFDLLRRWLEYRGYEVKFVQNFTDVDDKMIKRAAEEGCGVGEIARKYIAEYETDARGLGIRPASAHPRATESIGAITEMIAQIIDAGYAYESGGDVYFRSGRFGGYGKLSRMPAEELEAGARVEVTDVKENPADFTLWKASKPGEPVWESRFGAGRPGWHIECSAMAREHLGERIDIHCGGQDLIFPHHENEIAQTECLGGGTFANYWMHNGFINVDNRKMSKSDKNYFFVREAAKKHGYAAVRMFLLSAHYRSPVNFSEEILSSNAAALERIYTAIANADFYMNSTARNEQESPSAADSEKINVYRNKFAEAMDDDLNTADAIGVLFGVVRELNMAVGGNAGRAAAARWRGVLTELFGLLGFDADAQSSHAESAEGEKIPASEIEELIRQRNEARRNKNFAESDRIRDNLRESGVVLEDTPNGTKYKYVNQQ